MIMVALLHWEVCGVLSSDTPVLSPCTKQEAMQCGVKGIILNAYLLYTHLLLPDLCRLTSPPLGSCLSGWTWGAV